MTNLKNLFITLSTVLTLFIFSCKKEETKTSNPTTNTPQVKSKKALLNRTWVLYETFEDGVLKSSNGTGKYEFNQYGNIRSDFSGTFQDIGTYKFTSKDSNYLSVLFNGTSSPYLWEIKELSETKFNTEFFANNKRLNYNYKQ